MITLHRQASPKKTSAVVYTGGHFFSEGRHDELARAFANFLIDANDTMGSKMKTRQRASPCRERRKSTCRTPTGDLTI